MKLRIIFAAAIFVVGIAASMALAAPKDGNNGSTPTQTTSSTGDPGHGHQGKGDGPKGPKTPKPRCHELNLKGTLADGSLSLTVEKANKPGRDLVGTSVSVAVGGEANLHVRVCDAGAPGAAAGTTGLQLRSLKMAPGHPGKPGETPPASTTTTTTND